MQVNLTSKVDVDSDATCEILERSRDLEHYFNRIEDVNVVIDSSRHDHKPVYTAEILVNCEHKHDIVVKDEAKNIELAFHKAGHKAKRQVRKYKEQLQSHHNDWMKRSWKGAWKEEK